MSSSLCAVTVLILRATVVRPLIRICSPTINVPEVSLNVIVALLPPADFAKPEAPLLNPSTNAVSGNSVDETAVFKTRLVCV